jgi:hypothetical protein
MYHQCNAVILSNVCTQILHAAVTSFYAYLPTMHQNGYLTGQPKNVCINLLRKLKAICIDLTLLNSNMTTKILYHPPLLRERGLKSKTMFLIKKY